MGIGFMIFPTVVDCQADGAKTEKASEEKLTVMPHNLASKFSVR